MFCYCVCVVWVHVMTGSDFQDGRALHRARLRRGNISSIPSPPRFIVPGLENV